MWHLPKQTQFYDSLCAGLWSDTCSLNMSVCICFHLLKQAIKAIITCTRNAGFRLLLASMKVV